jgi:formylglycine-generating enzyme required for sulfatase activity
MSNKPKPQEWFYLQDETWYGPFKTSELKELVRKGLVDPSTLLRIGIAGVPIKAHQVKSLFPNYQGEEQAVTSSINNTGIPKNAPALIAGALLVAIVLVLIKSNLFKSNENVPKISLAEGIASIEKEMVLIPAGKFMMGARLQVTLTKPFYMGKYEVTQEQWESVMGNNPSGNTKGAKLPVTDVSWEDCQEFIKKLNEKTSGDYRLPTEAEWEYACRAGTTTAYSYGDNLTKSDANIEGDSIKAVGSYRPNAFGLYDMHGNVWEWCEDWYGSLQDGEVTDPKGAATGMRRVLRGGSFYLDASLARSSSREFKRSPTNRSFFNGFRLARTP